MAHDYVNPRSFMPGFARTTAGRDLARQYRREWQQNRPRVNANQLVRGGPAAGLAHQASMRAYRRTLFNKYTAPGFGGIARPVTPRRYER